MKNQYVNVMRLMNELRGKFSTRQLDIINRQKAEIKKLKQDNDILSRNADTAFQDGLNESEELYKNEVETEIKSEAIKEFAEHLKKDVEQARQKYQRLCKEQGENEDETMNIHFCGIVKIINNIVKEMTGEKENA